MPKIVSKTAKRKTTPTVLVDVERRNALTRGVLSYKDILDQPKGKYFLIVETSPMGSLLFSVDSIKKGEESIEAYSGDVLVTEFSPEVVWYTVSADYVDSITTEEMAKRNSEDNDLMHDLREKISKTSKKNGKKNVDSSAGYL